MGNEEILYKVIEYISKDLRDLLIKIPNTYKKDIEEIRIRINAPINILLNNKNYFLKSDGKLTFNPKEGVLVNRDHINKTFQLITNYSLYSLEDEIKNGFITLKGGHRVGFGGKVIIGNGKIEGIKDISSLNFRIGREKIGISNDIIHHLFKKIDDFQNTLIISPPQCGKTTLLRDIIRNLSNGIDEIGVKGFKIGLIDERSEIAGVYNGIPQKTIGIRTDVLDSCHKSLGIMMLIRSMSPEIIAVDEIGSRDDVMSIQEALRAGIKLIATIHGYSINDIEARASMEELFRDKVFKRYIILDNSLGVGTIKEIIEGESFKNLISRKRRLNVVV